jgi:hypothetical protein
MIIGTGGCESFKNSWSGFPSGAFLALTPVAAVVKENFGE